ncbi:LRR receptor-like serine/threonine-protein kinase GSO1 [Salvia divinorum]|uniref:LRR receptor-like serine/threonine-protein kinase GSO1 n=1 Tax=Salvia divinorum TaxID=28513 RepID=A0ABD1GDB4_SALDI
MFPQNPLIALRFAVYCLIHTTLAFVANPNTDRSSLLALKAHITSDPHNLLMKNWTTKTSVCNWIGITCDPLSNRVTGLNISDMQLVGVIPPEIGNLSSLTSLDMNENSFYGPIPASLFNISSIQVITLRGNALSSQLPIDMCKHSLHSLRLLRLSFNKLYGEIPSSLGRCSSLELLSLYNNSLVGEVPKEIGNLTLLTQLFLGFNGLNGMSSYLCFLLPLFYVSHSISFYNSFETNTSDVGFVVGESKRRGKGMGGGVRWADDKGWAAEVSLIRKSS